MTASPYRLLEDLIAQKKLISQRVFLRVDLNVPLKNGVILNDYRLQASAPTLDLLIAQHATIVLATHIGRPNGYDAALSTQHLVPWFAQRGYDIIFVADLEQAHTLSLERKHTLLLLENLRFFPGEKNNDPTFAQKLAQLGDYYVNDAFATLHRNDTSITTVPYLFAPEHRAIGLCVTKELTLLATLADQPKRPFILVIGGGKVADKIPLIMHLLEKIDTLLLCPAIVFSFLHAQGLPTGNSLVDEASKNLCLTLLEQARNNNVRILFPTDYIVAYDSFNGPLSKVPIEASDLQKNMVGISIGPDTAHRYAAELVAAGSVFVNGLMGSVQRPETLTGTTQLFTALAHNSTAVRVVGGGDSVAAAALLGFGKKIGHLSTGGGATLAYLSGQTLPGLAPFLYPKK